MDVQLPNFENILFANICFLPHSSIPSKTGIIKGQVPIIIIIIIRSTGAFGHLITHPHPLLLLLLQPAAGESANRMVLCDSALWRQLPQYEKDKGRG